MRLPFRALVFAALALASLPSAAQPGSDEDKRTRLFKEGKAAADAGEWASAADKFRKVVALRSAPKALIALGVAEEHLGHLVAALAAYKQAREEAADKALADELKTANAALDSIKPRVPKLLFSPSDILATANLEVDGAAAHPSEGALAVDPGQHVIAASSAGKGAFRTTVTIGEGEQREIVLSFDTGPAPTATATSSAPSTGSARPPTGAIVVGVLGVAIAGAGAALFAVGSGQYTDATKRCTGLVCPPDVAAQGNAGRLQIIAGDALLGVGAAAFTGAAIWWIASAASKKKDTQTTVLVTPRIGGLDITGRF